MQPRVPDAVHRLAAIVDSSDDAIVSKDLNGIIQTWNRAAERMFGYTADEAVGRSITMIVPPDRLSEEDTVLINIRAGRSVEHYETFRRRKDGTTIPISLTVSPIRDDQGVVIGASKIARDLSALRNYATQLEQTVRERSTALRLKDEFLATLSHELRTPLSAITGWLHLLRNSSSPERVERALEVIERNTSALSRMIEDLVDVSRIVGGKLQLKIEPTDMRAVINQAMDSVGPAATARGLQVRVTTGTDLPQIAGDADRLRQIVWNLLTNAIKFTPEGGRIDVDVSADKGVLSISVTDTGKGIAPDFLPHLFERFSQEDGGFTREHGGLGLGLAIVRHLVEMHGGTVDAVSEVGKGSTFRVRLPIVLATGVNGKRAANGAAPHRLDGLHALVVDDNVDGREAVAQILADAGARVTQASSAAEAYSQMKAEAPDVLVCDIGMPHEDGLTFIRRLRAEPDNQISTLPAIAMTAYTRAHDRDMSLAAGFQSYLSKPVVAADLVALISKNVTKH